MHLIFAAFCGILVASLSDWLFMGVLFHDRYQAFPEIWRDIRSEKMRILLSQAISILTVAGFVILAAMLSLFTLSGTLILALAIWLIAPLPLLLTNHLYIKLDAMITVAHSLGWLAKLALIACVTATLL